MVKSPAGNSRRHVSSMASSKATGQLAIRADSNSLRLEHLATYVPGVAQQIQPKFEIAACHRAVWLGQQFIRGVHDVLAGELRGRLPDSSRNRHRFSS